MPQWVEDSFCCTNYPCSHNYFSREVWRAKTGKTGGGTKGEGRKDGKRGSLCCICWFFIFIVKFVCVCVSVGGGGDTKGMWSNNNCVFVCGGCGMLSWERERESLTHKMCVRNTRVSCVTYTHLVSWVHKSCASSTHTRCCISSVETQDKGWGLWCSF